MIVSAQFVDFGRFVRFGCQVKSPASRICLTNCWIAKRVNWSFNSVSTSFVFASERVASFRRPSELLTYIVDKALSIARRYSAQQILFFEGRPDAMIPALMPPNIDYTFRPQFFGRKLTNSQPYQGSRSASISVRLADDGFDFRESPQQGIAA